VVVEESPASNPPERYCFDLEVPKKEQDAGFRLAFGCKTEPMRKLWTQSIERELKKIERSNSFPDATFHELPPVETSRLRTVTFVPKKSSTDIRSGSIRSKTLSVSYSFFSFLFFFLLFFLIRTTEIRAGPS
jgi:hypothetical protein